MMKRHLLTFFSENNFGIFHFCHATSLITDVNRIDDRRRREVLEREGVLWSRHWREKQAQEKAKLSKSTGFDGTTPQSSSSGEFIPSFSSNASFTSQRAWRSKRLSLSFSLNAEKLGATQDEFTLLARFHDEDQKGSGTNPISADPTSVEETALRQRKEGEERMRRKLARLEEICVSRYRNVLHHMKGDVRKGIITLSEKKLAKKSKNVVRFSLLVFKIDCCMTSIMCRPQSDMCYFEPRIFSSHYDR